MSGYQTTMVPRTAIVTTKFQSIVPRVHESQASAVANRPRRIAIAEITTKQNNCTKTIPWPP